MWVANGSPLTVMSCAVESVGQISAVRNVWNPVALDTDVVVLSGGRLKLNELKITDWSSCGKSCAYAPQQLPCPAMWLLIRPGGNTPIAVM